jgi:hypothetical protein
MGLKNLYKIFFAIPFDTETRSIYDTYVIPQLQAAYPQKLVCVVGNKQIGWTRQYDDVETFKMQNSELFKHFVSQIRDADVIVADLTDNNPNVHVELGIALTYNKNILRVTRQSFERLGFDVRNYEVDQYRKQEDLLNSIKRYLELFFNIKDLNFSTDKSSLYFSFPDARVLKCWNSDKEKQKIVESRRWSLSLEDSKFQMRDGKIRVDFRMLDQGNADDWFGIYIRVGSMGFLSGSILVYVRQNGEVEIAIYPGTRIVQKAKLPTELFELKTLIIEIEGDFIRVDIDDVRLEYKGLDIQSSGSVIFASHRSNTEYGNVQIVCRDTIETFDKFSLEG